MFHLTFWSFTSTQETDFNLRRTVIRFLTVLLTNCTKLLQERILESGPMGVSKLVDVSHGECQVIRNDVRQSSFSNYSRMEMDE